MNVEELEQKVQKTFPNAVLMTDNDGQFIVYTDLMDDGNGNVVPFFEEE